MIEDVKWLKPDDYALKCGKHVCWIAKDGFVSEGYFDSFGPVFSYVNFGRVTFVIPDGVCERKPNQQKPVLR